MNSEAFTDRGGEEGRGREKKTKAGGKRVEGEGVREKDQGVRE